MWATTWPMFAATNKRSYARLSLYVQHVLTHVHDSIKVVLNKRLMSMHGQSNHHFAPDMMTEKQNRLGRYNERKQCNNIHLRLNV
jgi:hypothetical protein